MRESLLWLLRDARSARKQGPAAIEQRQRTRLAEIVAYARQLALLSRALAHARPGRGTRGTLRCSILRTPLGRLARDACRGRRRRDDTDRAHCDRCQAHV